jgi:hypothetical protein
MNKPCKIIFSFCLFSCLVGQQSNNYPFSGKPPVTSSFLAKGKIEQIFKFTEDGFNNISYLVKYQDKNIIVKDDMADSDYSVGDEIHFAVAKMDMSTFQPGGKKIIAFTLAKPSNRKVFPTTTLPQPQQQPKPQ